MNRIPFVSKRDLKRSIRERIKARRRTVFQVVFLILMGIASMIELPALDVQIKPEISALPADVVAILAKQSLAENEIKAKAGNEILKTKLALVPVLTKAQEAATKAGNLDAALAVKAKLAEVQAEVDLAKTAADAAKPKAQTDQDKFQARFLGRWKTSLGYSWDLRDDGAATMSKGGSTWAGKWKLVPGSSAVEITWDSGISERIALPADGSAPSKVTSSNGATPTITRP
jgi:hypothetical protein